MKKLLLIILFVTSCYSIQPFSYYWTPKLTGDTITASRLKYNYDSIKNWSKRISDSANANYMHKSWYEKHDSTLKYMKLDTIYNKNAYINDSLYAKKARIKNSISDTASGAIITYDSISTVGAKLTRLFSTSFGADTATIKKQTSDTLSVIKLKATTISATTIGATNVAGSSINGTSITGTYHYGDTAGMNYIAMDSTSGNSLKATRVHATNIDATKIIVDSILATNLITDSTTRFIGDSCYFTYSTTGILRYNSELKYKDTIAFQKTLATCTLRTVKKDGTFLYDNTVQAYYSWITGWAFIQIPDLTFGNVSDSTIVMFKNLPFRTCKNSQEIIFNADNIAGPSGAEITDVRKRGSFIFGNKASATGYDTLINNSDNIIYWPPAAWTNYYTRFITFIVRTW